ncbi:uracil-DNA glycosylase [candidate division KSB1 bacterium]|nr:uracil-DNA glycosylase [candidate division KSB1 bacterium]
MSISQKNINGLFVRYLEQQKDMFGDGFIMSTKQLNAIEQAMQPQNSSPFSESNSGKITLVDFYHQIKECQKCSLGKTRKNFVFGSGNPNADAMFIGEAPGADEDSVGKPFVGKAGQLLTKMLAAINFNREDVFIANILKCRPPNNRDPLPEEVNECEPYLHRQIELIQPKVMMVLGRISGQTLLRTSDSLRDLRGKLNYYCDIPMIVTFHPAALLRNPNWKYNAWDDLKYFRKVYDVILAGDDPKDVIFESNYK